MIQINLILFILWSMTIIYLRVLVIYFTSCIVLKRKGYEANPLMKNLISNKYFNLLYISSLIIVGYMATLHELILIDSIFMFIVLFILWIDFQHDLEQWNFYKKCREHGIDV